MTDRGPVTQSPDEMKSPPGYAHCGMAHMAGRAFLRRKDSGKRRWRKGKRKRPQEKEKDGVRAGKKGQAVAGGGRRRVRGRKENPAAGREKGASGGRGARGGRFFFFGGGRGREIGRQKTNRAMKISRRGEDFLREGHEAGSGGGEGARERRELGRGQGKRGKRRERGAEKRNSREREKECGKIPGKEKMRKKSRRGRGVWDLGSKRGKAGVGRHQFFG